MYLCEVQVADSYHDAHEHSANCLFIYLFIYLQPKTFNQSTRRNISVIQVGRLHK